MGFLLKQVEQERWRQPPTEGRSKPVDSEEATLGRLPDLKEKERNARNRANIPKVARIAQDH